MRNNVTNATKLKTSALYFGPILTYLLFFLFAACVHFIMYQPGFQFSVE